MAFQLADTVNRQKVFLFKWSELEGRLDPFCYIPSLVFLDKLIKLKTDKRLKDFAVGYSSGATPSKDESDIHYTTQEEGFPFVRVQNLSTSGELCFDNMKYISRETHNGLLSRSKVFSGDLLIKITGVGRMAVASVAPAGFEGNINQHIVVIRTGSMAISLNLAAFINLDCIEKLASKRATGGTRPALDYPALFSLPVISDNRFREKIAMANAAKKQKEAQAQELLDSIDSYLLRELGIELPLEEENGVCRRMFVRRFSEVSGGRLDAPGNWNRLSLVSTTFDNVAFASQVEINPLTDLTFADDTTEVTFVPMEAVSEVYAEAGLNQTRALAESKGYTVFQNADLIWAKITPCMENGKSAVVQELLNGVGFGSTEFHVFRSKGSVDINYVHALLRLKCLRRNAVNFFSGSAGHQRVDELFFRKLTIPLPPLEKQNEIAAHIQTIRDRARKLRAEAAVGLERAKQEVEAMITGRN